MAGKLLKAAVARKPTGENLQTRARRDEESEKRKRLSGELGSTPTTHPETGTSAA
jgi:hypothetical protein